MGLHSSWRASMTNCRPAVVFPNEFSGLAGVRLTSAGPRDGNVADARKKGVTACTTGSVEQVMSTYPIGFVVQ